MISSRRRRHLKLFLNYLIILIRSINCTFLEIFILLVSQTITMFQLTDASCRRFFKTISKKKSHSRLNKVLDPKSWLTWKDDLTNSVKNSLNLFLGLLPESELEKVVLMQLNYN